MDGEIDIGTVDGVVEEVAVDEVVIEAGFYIDGLWIGVAFFETTVFYDCVPDGGYDIDFRAV